MTDKEKVLDRWPRSYVFRDHSKKEIRRPREPFDVPGLVPVPYKILSGIYNTDEDAWKDAARRLIEF
jgi:hypothetical protein